MEDPDDRGHAEQGQQASSGSPPPPPQLDSADGFRKACIDLTQLWQARPAITPNPELPGNVHARLHAVNGLSSHAYRLGDAAVHLMAKGASAESVPMVRAALECGVTAIWTAQVPDGLEALLNEDYRSRTLMARTMTESGVMEELGFDLPTPADEAHDSRSNAQARQFKQLCDDLSPGGAEVYSYYRALCWFSHPTNYVMDLYSELVDAGAGSRLRLRRAPLLSEDLEIMFSQMCATALVVAASALDMMDVDRSHRSRIEGIAGRVGCAPDLRLSERALRRLSPAT